MGSERRRWGWSPHLHLGLAFCNFRVLAIEIFLGLTWRVRSLEAETVPPKGPNFVSFPVVLPLGLP